MYICMYTYFFICTATHRVQIYSGVSVSLYKVSRGLQVGTNPLEAWLEGCGVPLVSAVGAPRYGLRVGALQNRALLLSFLWVSLQ